MMTFFLLKRTNIFKGLKRILEKQEKKKNDAINKIWAIEKLFNRQNEVKFAFYYIKMSRNKLGSRSLTCSTFESPQTGIHFAEQDNDGHDKPANKTHFPRNQT